MYPFCVKNGLQKDYYTYNSQYHNPIGSKMIIMDNDNNDNGHHLIQLEVYLENEKEISPPPLKNKKNKIKLKNVDDKSGLSLETIYKCLKVRKYNWHK